MGRAKTAAVGDPMEVVNFLFLLCANVCGVADPRLTPNFKDLLLDDLAPRARIDVLWMAFAPDVRKRDVPAAPVDPRHGGIPICLSPGPPAQGTLDLLMAVASQKNEKAAHNASERLPKTEPEQQKKHTLADLLVFKFDFEDL